MSLHYTVIPCRNTLIYAHSTSRTLPTCDMSPDLQTVAMQEAGDSVESPEPYIHSLLQKLQNSTSAKF
jgi:hypothetical protein